MERIAHIAGALLLILPLAATGQTITFHESAYVRGPEVMLGEIADIDGDESGAWAGMTVAAAATPQDSKRLRTDLLLARLRSDGVDTGAIEVRGPAVIEATTLHQELGAKTVADHLRAYIEANMPWDAADALIDVEDADDVIILPEGRVEVQWLPASAYNWVGQGTFRGTVLVDGRQEQVLLRQVTLDAYVPVVVATAEIQRGQWLGPLDVRTEKRLLSGMAEKSIPVPDDITQFTARRAIHTGEIITESALAPRILVKRRQLVAVAARAGGLDIQTQARAESDAAAGDIITCTNIGSKETFQGIVLNNGTVYVP